jgi:phosphoketolase
MQQQTDDIDAKALGQRAAAYRADNAAFADWAAGHGVIAHSDATQVSVHDRIDRLVEDQVLATQDLAYRILSGADRVSNAAMWLVVHMTYAQHVYPDGRELTADDFKLDPEGHTGGSLNMVPAYVGYLAANALSGITRAWLMGQGHCVSAIDAVNLLVDNMSPAHARRYDTSEQGLTRFVRDFYAYDVTPDGRAASPLGSHVNAHTAGGMIEGGYLGFAELQYVHMPLPGERLVTFLSDGAFEEQRGGDWAPRWWRAEDCGLVAPIMILNGRRIDQRSSMAMRGGSEWLCGHLRHNGFAPVLFDGRDPAAFACAILEMEDMLVQEQRDIAAGRKSYPAALPYGIAETEKGYGFPGAGTNRAHNLPLQGNPASDRAARDDFNAGARRLWVAADEVAAAAGALNTHPGQRRVKEREHPLARRHPPSPTLPEPPWQATGNGSLHSAMGGIDRYFCAIVDANPGLRTRVGNPDEMRSNKLDATLDRLKHRVAHPEPGIAEDPLGCVITALNEEAVVSAALANKGGLNLVASYEAFAGKMLGALRQELTFARQQRAAGEPPGWLSVPVIATSHTWENGKNELSHQDPTFCQSMLGEPSDVSRVVFPADWNSAVAALRACYATRGQVWTLVVAKRALPAWLTPAQAQQAVDQGAVLVRPAAEADHVLQLVATGAYQLVEAMKASARLQRETIAHSVVYLQEPGRYRTARDDAEAAAMAPAAHIDTLFPASAKARVFLTHTRPEAFIGTVWPLLTDPLQTPVLGYINRGGTLDEAGMLFANQCTWAHAVAAAAVAIGETPDTLLDEAEYAALVGKGDPAAILEAELAHVD